MRRFSLKSITSKLSFSFIIVTCTVFLVFGVTYPMILNMFAEELEQNTSERMQNALLRLDDSLNNIQQQIFSLNHSLEFKNIVALNDGTEYDKFELWKKATQTLRDFTYIEAYSLIIRGQDDIITGSGIYPIDKYFDRYWNHPQYNADFWKKELNKSFYIKYYPQGTFTSHAFGENENSKTVIPIAFKSSFDKRYMIITFVDIQAMCRDIDPYIMENLSVYYKDEPLIACDTNIDMDFEEYLGGENLGIKTTKDSYTVICRSTFNDFIYVKNTPIREIRSGLNHIYMISFCIVAVTLLISAGAIFIVTRKLARPFVSILEMLNANHLVNERNISEFSFIEDNLKHLFDSNQQIARELDEKNVMLSGFLYQSKLKNIYMNIQNDPKGDGEGRELTYYLISFLVIYRNHVSALINKSYSEISYVLKEHLEQVLKHYFPSLLLFQPEENSFFAKVGLSLEDQPMPDVMEKVRGRLEIEKEYCYFLIAVSSEIQDESLITEDYYSLLELQQQFSLKESGQILFMNQEHAEHTYANPGSQQTGDLKKLVSAADSEGALNLVSNMLDSGLTSKTTRLNAIIFCSNIVNVLMQTLSEKFISLPPELPVQSLYNQMIKCIDEKAFRELVLTFTETVLLYVSRNSTAKDPLVLGVMNYVEGNYSKEFTMEMMSDSLKISKSYLSTYFKTKTSVNLIDYIQQFRVQKAIELMKNSNIRLSDIGSQVGISNSNSFIRVFKKHTGITPSEYRKNLNI